MAEWKRQVSWRFRAWHFSIGEMGRPLTNPSASLVLSTRIDLARSRSAAKENLLPRYVINPPPLYGWNGYPINSEGWLDLLIFPRSLCGSVREGLIRPDYEVCPGCPSLKEGQNELSFLKSVAYNCRIIGELGPERSGKAVPPENPMGLHLGVRKC